MALEAAWFSLQSEVVKKQSSHSATAKIEDLPPDQLPTKAALNLTDRLEKQQQQEELQQKPGTKRKRGSTAKERISKMPPCTAGKRSSIYRGVTRHRWTGRYEAHLWDKGTWNHTQNKKGKQVYLGAYDDEEAAARAYDLAALKYWGPGTLINFPVSDYSRDIEEMQAVSREEYLASLRRKSSGFSRGVSKYRGVARHHHNGRWEARIGRVFGNKYLYLGTYGTQEEAATAYDMAAIEYRGLNAVTNFDLSRYIRWLRPGQQDNNIPSESTNKSSASSSDFMTEVLNKNKDDHPHQPHSNSTSSSSRIWPMPPTEPYQLPSLGLTSNVSKLVTTNSNGQKPTALSLLLQSNMFKQMLEKTSGNKRKSVTSEPDERQCEYLVDDIQQHQQQQGGNHHQNYQEQDEEEQTDATFPFLGSSSSEDALGTAANEDEDDTDGAGLSLWSAFGSNFSSLSSPITTC